MMRMMIAACLMLIVAPALARQFPVAPVRTPGGRVRSFSLTNRSGQVIVSAQARMTDGTRRVLTYAPIRQGHAREIVVPRHECLESLTVHLNDGQTLRAAHMNDCATTRIVVGRAGIGIGPGGNSPGRGYVAPRR